MPVASLRLTHRGWVAIEVQASNGFKSIVFKSLGGLFCRLAMKRCSIHRESCDLLRLSRQTYSMSQPASVRACSAWGKNLCNIDWQGDKRVGMVPNGIVLDNLPERAASLILKACEAVKMALSFTLVRLVAFYLCSLIPRLRPLVSGVAEGRKRFWISWCSANT